MVEKDEQSVSEEHKLTLEELKHAVSGTAAAFRCITEYQPVGGPGDKVFPPTYEGGKYATEKRMLNGQLIDCVLLDSVQSQANRMELALLEALRAGRIKKLPLLTVRFDDASLPKKFSVTSLEAPHRAADAIFRDSKLDGVMFRKTSAGMILDIADTRNARGLYGLCPTALVFGLWDSTGPRGGLGAKFQRAVVSEMIGWNAQDGTKTSSRIDPLQVQLGAGPLFKRAKKTNQTPEWTLDEASAKKEKEQSVKLGKDGKPSEANHGNVTPSISPGGYTISKATQTSVISLAALRRLRFPADASDSDPKVDLIARVTLTALGLTACVLAREEGADLRSRCQMYPQQDFVWELMEMPDKPSISYKLNGKEAIDLLNGAIDESTHMGLPWNGEIQLTPSKDLIELVRKSQELAMHQVEGD
jgi:CRISPR-associated protein Csb1